MSRLTKEVSDEQASSRLKKSSSNEPTRFVQNLKCFFAQKFNAASSLSFAANRAASNSNSKNASNGGSGLGALCTRLQLSFEQINQVPPRILINGHTGHHKCDESSDEPSSAPPWPRRAETDPTFPVFPVDAADPTRERYGKIVRENKSILPFDFLLRKFPFSSCEQTFTTDSNSNSSSGNSPSPVTENSDLLPPPLPSPSPVPPPQVDGTAAATVVSNNNKRFYHVFKRGELDELIRQHVTSLHIYESFYDHGNWVVCATKL